MKFFPSLPKTSVRRLLFIAAMAWLIAGFMLLYKGVKFLIEWNDRMLLMLMISLISGLLFYFLLFTRISRRHTLRIMNLKKEERNILAFFNVRGYLIMILMISFGILLRTSGIISPKYLSFLYLSMGLPLFLSAFRFIYCGVNVPDKTS